MKLYKLEIGLHWVFFALAAFLVILYLWPKIVLFVLITACIGVMLAIKFGYLQVKIKIE